MKKVVWVSLLVLTGCAMKDKYDVTKYYNLKEQDEILASIVAYVFTAPPYVKMNDRLKPEFRSYYLTITSKFAIDKYYIAEDGTHYFYIVRPGPKMGEKRGVGGHFKLGDNYQLSEFREEFVTPLLPERDVRGRCAFLFDEMVKGNLSEYLKMETYVQWPNPVSYYDTINYEWRQRPDL